MTRPQQTRRELLAAGGAGALGLVVAACGGQSSTSSTGGQSGGGSSLAGRPVEKRMVVANWVDFQDPENLKRFGEHTGVRVVKEGYGSEEELLAKLKAGGSAYDLCVPGGSGLAQLRKRKLVRELDQSLIPNLKNLLPAFTGEGYDPGNRFSVPKDYGITSFFYRTEAVRQQPRTMADAFEMLRALPGSARVNFIESANETINAALAALGHSINTTDERQLEQARDLLLQVKPKVDTISATYLERGERGEIDFALGYSGDARRIQGARAKAGDEVRFLIPEGPAQYFVDLWVLPSAGRAPVAAHKFVNFVLDPRNAARELSYVQFGVPVRGVERYAPAALVRDPTVSIPPERIEDYETAQPYTAAVERKRNEIYTAFKAA